MTIIQLITTYPVNRKCSVHCPSLGGSWTCTLQVRVVMLKKIARQLWEVTRTVDCLNNTWTTSNLSVPRRSASNFSTIYEKKVWHADQGIDNQEDVELNSPSSTRGNVRSQEGESKYWIRIQKFECKSYRKDFTLVTELRQCGKKTGQKGKL